MFLSCSDDFREVRSILRTPHCISHPGLGSEHTIIKHFMVLNSQMQWILKHPVKSLMVRYGQGLPPNEVKPGQVLLPTELTFSF
jgi:hypothetical protein